ncbi:hypothetical protein WJR50_29980 [Catalinimonas sp. 4WD22]|uniref:hypothetical protein n=1 Tax=Catalinimonas locisalis TaxID=3133978 RepID=UPI003101780F
MNFKDILYSVTCLAFTIVIGAAVYEHLAVVPQWSAAPPKSLSMFQGEYGLKAVKFWGPIHPVAIVLFIASMIVSWRTPRKIYILISMIGYLLVIIITFSHFVPELLAITMTPFSGEVNVDLTQRSQQWEILSLVRLLFLMILSIILFLGLTKGASLTNKASS